MGRAVAQARRMNLEKMRPRAELATTGYCLANAAPDGEYLVLLPAGGRVTLDLRATPGLIAAEWILPSSGAHVAAPAVQGGDRRTFTAPTAAAAVLYLRGLRGSNK